MLVMVMLAILYVSPAGSDAASGSQLHPVATLQRAHDILADTRPDRDVTIRVMSNGGRYLNHAVILNNNKVSK